MYPMCNQFWTPSLFVLYTDDQSRDQTGTQLKTGYTCNGSYSLCTHAGRYGNFPLPKSLDCVAQKLQ
jgi:hypothetical protein